ncbi:MAG: helix-turn-helix domain-containing protein [Lautropia sp.]|nr:helix-turn-helix domain-containing protein [Lautropia sp.]
MVLKVGLLMCPGISPFHFSVPYMVFGDAMPGPGLFDLYVVAERGQEVDTAARMKDVVQVRADGALSLLETVDIVIVPGWADPECRPSAGLTAALRRAADRGAWLVGLCYGTYALAYGGLLDGRRAATHWLAEQDFCRRFPTVKLDTNALYVEDGRMITSAGTAASLDCCLHIVRRFHGGVVANQVARVLVVPPHRDGGQAQFIDRPVPSSTKDMQLNRLLDFLRQHLHIEHSIDVLAGHMAMSRRTFTRHFSRATGMTLGQWLVNERLQHSLPLLESGTLSIDAVAEQVGFESSAAFRLHFKRRYRVSPAKWRQTFAHGRQTPSRRGAAGKVREEPLSRLRQEPGAESRSQEPGANR